MRLLLDTHVFLWLQTKPDRLGDTAALLADERHELLLSAASSWEIAIKHGIGRLALPVPPAEYVPSRAKRSGVGLLPIDHGDVLAVADLPPHHRDPFDRLLVAQARRHELTLATADPELGRYDVPIFSVGS